MKKYVLMLTIFIIGCQSRKQVEPPKDEVFAGHKVLNVDCKDETNQINIHPPSRALVTDCYAIEAAMNERFGAHKEETGLEYCQRFQDASDEFNKQHPNDTVSYGCGNIHPARGINIWNDPAYSNNPLSPGNEAVILPDKPAKKHIVKKYKPIICEDGTPMPTGEDMGCGPVTLREIEQPHISTPDKAAVPDGAQKAIDSFLTSGTALTLAPPPGWSVVIGSDNNIEVTDPKHELRCYGGTIGNADFSDASTGFTITCITKSVEKAK